jgi:hypothetical protein
MIGTMISRLTGKIRQTENSTARRPARRFQAGLGIEGLEGRVVLSDVTFGSVAVQGFGLGQRDLITVGLPTNADQDENIETTTFETDPVDLNLTPTLIGEGETMLA